MTQTTSCTRSRRSSSILTASCIVRAAGVSVLILCLWLAIRWAVLLP